MAAQVAAGDMIVESKKDRHLRLLTERLVKIEHDFAESKESLYHAKLNALKKEMKEIENGTHPEYLQRLALLEKEKDFLTLKANLWKEYQLEFADKMYTEETEAVEQEYFVERDTLKERLLQQIEEKKRKLNEEKELLTIDNDDMGTGDLQQQMRNAPRKLRKRGNDSMEKLSVSAFNGNSSLNVSRRKQGQAPVLSFKLKDTEIVEDFNILAKVYTKRTVISSRRRK